MAMHSPVASSSASPPASDPLSVRPFFENKARAFWTLQAAGWSGYLVLRSVVGISNGFSVSFADTPRDDSNLSYITPSVWYESDHIIVELEPRSSARPPLVCYS